MSHEMGTTACKMHIFGNLAYAEFIMIEQKLLSSQNKIVGVVLRWLSASAWSALIGLACLGLCNADPMLVLRSLSFQQLIRWHSVRNLQFYEAKHFSNSAMSADAAGDGAREAER
jgi:hypothetical protein